MGKLSSSKRERRSNTSSSAIRRKSDGIKSRRMKSKKSSSRRRRRHDSDSWSSESDYDRSSSTSSDSYSSSEDFYRRNRRSRSFSRKDGCKSKKRVRRDSHSFTSDERSPPSKRRKESKRKGGGSRSRRKSDRSRYGRDASVGYSSCSTCANRSGSEDECESYRGRSERRESFVEVRDNRNRDRSGSCSSCRQCSHSSCGRDSMFRSEERAPEENNSKRLRSVIVVVNAEEKEGEEKKEEVVYDKDDYPSSRSNDGNDDERKKDVLDTKGMFESGLGKEVVVSKLHGEPIGAGGNWQDVNQVNSRPSPGTNHEDLETMLRQRALQNLQKLRGIKKAATSHASQEPTVAAAEESEFPREDQVNATGATSRDSSGDLAEKIIIIKEKTVYARQGMVPTGKQSRSAPEGLVRRTAATIPRQEILSAVAPAFSIPWRTAYTWTRESALIQPPAKQLISHQKPKPLQQKPLRTEISTTTSAAENPQTESALNQPPTKNSSSPQKPKQLQADPMVTETTNSVSFSKSGRNESASNVPPAEELSVPEIPKPFLAKPTTTEMAITASAVMSGLNGNASDHISLNEVPHQSTDAKSAPGAGSSEEDPHYEQKTMSVTRGGKTIPVNYQVYIPKRTPALARRQLKPDS